jgi:hypothetical protein
MRFVAAGLAVLGEVWELPACGGAVTPRGGLVDTALPAPLVGTPIGGLPRSLRRLTDRRSLGRTATLLER